VATGAGSTMALKPEANGMDYDQDKVDEMTLALLWLTSFKDPPNTSRSMLLIGCRPMAASNPHSS
jgi:hypothetical protein